jgi:hypothetical protein
MAMAKLLTQSCTTDWEHQERGKVHCLDKEARIMKRSYDHVTIWSSVFVFNEDFAVRVVGSQLHTSSLLSSTVRAQVMFQAHFVHIDEEETCRIGQNLSRSLRASQIAAALNSIAGPHTVHIVPLQDVLGTAEKPGDTLERLKKLLGSVLDQTARQDLQASLRLHLLRSTADKLGCNKLLVGDSSTKLAASFISASAKV